MSDCTRMPFVVCDPETYDDEVFIFFSEEDAMRGGQEFLKANNPLKIFNIEIEEYYKQQPPEYREFPVLNSLIIGVDIDRELRRQKITRRLKQRLDEGMVDEVKALLEGGIASEDLIYYGLEYKYLTLYATGVLSFDDMFRQLETAIHQFAKRQMTWFRGMERRGFTIHWLDARMSTEEKVEKIMNLLDTKS